MTQIALPLDWPATTGQQGFLIGAANARAVAMLDGWRAWPAGVALLTGPARSGRSLLARLFAARAGASVFDDAEHADETALFHAWNSAADRGTPLLLVAAAPPPGWAIDLPDLRSRIAATPHAAILPPDDELMRALLAMGFERRHADARDDLLDWLVNAIERRYDVAERAVAVLDRAAVEQRRRLTVPFARATLASAGLVAPPALSEDR